MIRIGMVQAPSLPEPSRNMDTLRTFAARGQREGCDVLCFPECFLTGYVPEHAAALALSADCPTLQSVSNIAKEFAVDLLVGYMERQDDRFFISHGIFLRDGSRAFYRKTHLGEKEQRFFTPGDRLAVFTLSGGEKIGLQLCVETHFPEISQTLALRGAEIIFAPHAVPRVAGDRESLWRRYIPARSYDNRVYFACCNQWDNERFGGGLLVTDPQGECVAAAFGDAPQLLTCEIHADEVRRLRTKDGGVSPRFFPSRRRKALYE